MQFQQLLPTLLLASVFLTGCQKATPDQSAFLEQTAYAELTLTPMVDDLRQAELINKTTGGSKGFLLLDDDDLMVQVAVRQGSGTPVCQELKFNKVKGQTKVTFTGQIKLPKMGAGKYEISGIVLRKAKKDGKVFATATNPTSHLITTTESNAFVMPTEHGADQKVEHRLPYVFDWKEIKLSPDKKRLDPITLHFRPSGTLLRVNITNQLAEPCTVKAIRVKTNAFFRKWEYDLANLKGGNLLEGKVASAATWTKDFPITPITVQPSKTSGWYYIWVMPTKATTGLDTTIDLIDSKDGSTYYAFKTTSPLKLKGVRVNLKLRGSNTGGDFGGSVDSGEWTETN